MVAMRRTLVLAALLLAPTGARGDYKDEYKAGVEAAKRGDWPTVERRMRSAIAERPQEAKSLGALFFRDYLPHYYLGLARFEQGDCRAALESWETSTSQGVIRRVTEEWADLQGKRRTCENRLAEVETAARDAQAAIAEARDLLTRAIGLARSPELAPVWATGAEPTLASRQRRLSEQLETAEAKLTEGSERLSVGEVREATNEARTTGAALQTLLSDGARRRDEVRAAIATRRGAVDVAAAEARRAVAAVARLSPIPGTVNQAKAAVEVLLREVATLPELADLARLDTLDQELRTATARLRRLAEPPPQGLVDAIEAYLAGDYRGALTALDANPQRDNRGRAQACLLRAAANYSLWILGGEQDPTLEEAARAAAAECRGLGGTAVKPTSKLFSPRFVEFWSAAPNS